MQPTDMKGNKGGYEFSQGLHFAFDKIQVDNIEINTLLPCLPIF